MKYLRFLVGGLATLVAPTLVVATEEPLESAIFDHVDVSVVNVDVIVLDKKGEPVTGLTAEDFVVREDGQPVTLTNFREASRDGRREAIQPIDPAPGAPRARETEAPGGEDRDDPVVMVVYVDNVHLTPHRRNTYLDQIRDQFVTNLRPEDRIMVVAHGNDLQIGNPFSNDPAQIEQALNEIRDQIGEGVRDRLERRQALSQIRDVIELALATDSNPCTDQFALMLSAARGYADSARGRAGRSLQGLTGLTSALAGVPGRKIVLYMSDGIGLYPGFDLFHMLSEICPGEAADAMRQGQEVNLIETFHRLTSQANANRITFYALDATGTGGGSSTDASYAGPIGTPGSGQSYDVRPSPANDMVRRSNQQNTIFTLANETGGRAMFNGNDVSVDLAEMSRDAQTYYALGFQPAHPRDGRVHRIKVELAHERKGTSLRYRRTYLDKTAETRTAERTLAALRFGFEDNPLGISVTTGSPQSDEQGQMVLPLRIALELGELAIVPRDGIHEGKVEVVISTQDTRDRPVDMRRQLIPIQIAEALIESARDEAHVVEVAIPLVPGETVLAVAVRDVLATTTSFLQHRVHLDPSGGFQ